MKNTSTKDRKEYFKRYREQNKEKIAEYKREYYQENKEKIKKYREENKEKLAEYKREYYQENKEKIAGKNKKYREENKEKRQNKHNNKCNMDCLNCIYDDCIMS